MRTKHAYRTAGKLSLGLILLGGVIALTLPAIRKKVWYSEKPSPSFFSKEKEHDVILPNPAIEEISVVQTRCHPGI